MELEDVIGIGCLMLLAWMLGAFMMMRSIEDNLKEGFVTLDKVEYVVTKPEYDTIVVIRKK